MLGLALRGVRDVVAIGAHPDDIEIAAGGTLLALAATGGLRVRYVLLTGDEQRQREARTAAAEFLAGAEVSLHLYQLPDGRLPAQWERVKQILQDLATEPADLVLAPSWQDAHQDHRLIAELVPTAFRDSLLLQYEIPKWDGDLGRPNVYLPMAEATARRKVELLHACFPSQKDRDWWDDEVFLGLARLRGVECRARYAEAFHCHKSVLELPAGR